MKNALTSSQGTAPRTMTETTPAGSPPGRSRQPNEPAGRGSVAVSEPWRAALRTFDADLQRRGSAERTRKAYGTDAAELAAWATANALDPTEVDYKALRRWAARLS